MNDDIPPELARHLVDACPDCDERVLATPAAALANQDSFSLSCVYACPACDRTWSTSWDLIAVTGA